MLYEKNFFANPVDMKDYLEAKGFIFVQGEHYGDPQYDIQEEMRWGEADQDSSCYWGWNDNSGIRNFVDSNGNEVFSHALSIFPARSATPPYRITDFRATGVLFCRLKNNGIILNIAPFSFDAYSQSASILNSRPNLINDIQNYFTLSCEFPKYDSDGTMVPSSIRNGLVACTPAESDGRWRHSWREQRTPTTPSTNTYMPPSFRWTVDAGIMGSVSTLPTVQRWDTQFSLALSKVVLPQGFFSNNIYTQVMGQNTSPGMIFTINGQRFISFCPETISEQYLSYIDDQGDQQVDTDAPVRNSLLYRPICFLLADDIQLINDHTSTQEYSSETVYAAGDYCIYNGALYICTTAITTPEPWDVTHWERTTVSAELTRN